MPRSGFTFPRFAVLALLPLRLWGTTADDIGYSQLQTLLGGSTPNGAGVAVVQVEAPDGSNNYSPNTSSSNFAGITFNFRSGASGTSSHADSVASIFYGNASIASGVTSVFLYNANGWVGADYLHAGTGSTPDVSPGKVQNHSWIGTTGSPSADTDILRRVDFAVNRDQTIVVAGINNGSSNPQPELLAGAYNIITVGLTNGDHSRGGTTSDGSGRLRPDIVAPAGVTSFSTPLVSAAAAVLVQVGNSQTNPTIATRADVVKSLLLAGATKEEFGASWTRTNTQPLDAVFGAGELNVYNSYLILNAGARAPATNALASTTGWSFASVSSVAPQSYFFEVPVGSQLSNLSAVLTWNRDIDLSLNASLANLSLHFYSATGFILGSELDWSDSTIDNVESIWWTTLLNAGNYALVVRSSSGIASASYALSWRSDLTAIPEPSQYGAALGFVVAVAAFWRRQREPAKPGR